ADVLDQVQPGVIGSQLERTLADPQLLEPGLALRSLRDAEERDVREADLGERCLRRADLPLAPVDEDRVGRHALPARDPSIAARERLVERAVVVARREALDVVAAGFTPAPIHPILSPAPPHPRLGPRVSEFAALHTLPPAPPPRRWWG